LLAVVRQLADDTQLGETHTVGVPGRPLISTLSRRKYLILLSANVNFLRADPN